MRELLRRELDGVVAYLAHSTKADGDLSPSGVDADLLTERREAAVRGTWHALHQVHGDRIVHATAATSAPVRPHADALITSEPHQVLAVHSGDCVPVGFVHTGGIVAAAHAGWKGLEAGILASTVAELRQTMSADSGSIVAAIGPHIRAAQYEFGTDDLDRLARRFGPDVIAETVDGMPALDLTAAIEFELTNLGVEVVAQSPDCTAASAEHYWSHRARHEDGRIALVAWLEPT